MSAGWAEMGLSCMQSRRKRKGLLVGGRLKTFSHGMIRMPL